MSYDLFFRSRSPTAPFSREAFLRHFSGRSKYEVRESQAFYSNEDTGVYFSFDFSERDEASEIEDEVDSSLIPVTFNLNYFRPHVFGLEAESEVAAFVREFALTVSDPQMSGMSEGEYSAEGFLRGWNAGNAFGYRAIISQDSTQRFHSLPSSRIQSIWQWNYNREALQSELGESVFVPRILCMDAGGKLETAVAWVDGIPILLPTVDLLIVPRETLAPRRWFRSTKDMVMLNWQEIEPTLQPFRKRTGDLASYELFYNATPPDIERLIRAKQPPPQMPTGVPYDQVLDRELLEQAQRRLTSG